MRATIPAEGFRLDHAFVPIGQTNYVFFSILGNPLYLVSVASAARIKYQSWGKILALNLHCFVINALSVAISLFFVKTCWQEKNLL